MGYQTTSTPQRKLAIGLCVAFLVIGVVFVTIRDLSNCNTTFTRQTGDTIDCAPSKSDLLHIRYGDKNIDTNPQLLTQQQTSVAPLIELAADRRGYSTLIMSDPDAPSPEDPSAREWLHWLVVDIPPDRNFSDGRVLMEYAPPTPPKGEHRYIFSLYKQFRHVEALPLPDRAHFSTRAFVAQTPLYSSPIDAAYFTVKAS